MDYLAINIGSSSKKYTFFSGTGERVSVVFTKRHTGTFVAVGGTTPLPAPDTYDTSFAWMVSHICTVIPHVATPSEWRMGVRVVMPGAPFAMHRAITLEFLVLLAEGVDQDPVHVQPVLDEVHAILEAYPEAYLLACSDSAFHRTLPPIAYTYALPREVRARCGVRRFGYHGLALASVVRILEGGGGVPERTVVCHLGSGASVTALCAGVSVETSMGYSPLEGIPMSTRIGDIGAGAVLELARTEGIAAVGAMLYESSGLIALSGYTNDMEVLVRDMEGTADARFAVESFVYHVVRQVAVCVSALGGLDALVFSGGMAERSATIRRMVTQRLAFLGVILDADKNDALVLGENLSSPESAVAIRVVSPQEEDEMRTILETMHQ